jgi:hypothetical protein
MKKILLLAVVLATSAMVPVLEVRSAPEVPEDGWELKKDRDGIRVYVRESPGTQLKELRFSTQVRSSLHTIAAVLTHVEGFDDWVYASVASRTVRQVSPTEVYYYAELDFPWPFDNRDLVLHSRIWQDARTNALHSQAWSRHWMVPEQAGKVRIKKAELHWTFTPLGNGNIQVEYYLCSDPGGNIPAWMVNLAADQGPLETMIKFKSMLNSEKYRHKKLSFVKEGK